MTQENARHTLDELSNLEAIRDHHHAAAKRQYRRFIVRGEARLHAMGGRHLDHKPIHIQLRDAAMHGFGFVCHETLPVDFIWRLELQQQDHVVGQQAVRIRHCRNVGDHIFLIGAVAVVDTGLLSLLCVDPSRIAEPDGPRRKLTTRRTSRRTR